MNPMPPGSIDTARLISRSELRESDELFALHRAKELTETLLRRLDRITELAAQCHGDICRGSPPVHLAPAKTSELVETKAASGHEIDEPVDRCAQATAGWFRPDHDDATVVLFALCSCDGCQL